MTSIMSRRQFGVHLAAAGLSQATWPSVALAQERFPSRSIRIIVPWAAGTAPDVAVRTVAAKLPEPLAQSVFVENRPGASGAVGIAELARAPADGYTLGALHFSTATVASLYPQFKSDLAKDFVGLGQIEWGHSIMVVSPTLGVQSIAELINYTKKDDKAAFASSGVGAPAHLSGLMFLRATGLQAQHAPYNNFGQAITDVSTGRVTFMVMSASAAVPQVLGGKLKALAVTGPQRNASLPQVPTVTEIGLPTMQARTWSGLIARVDTPKDLVDRLSRDIAAVMAMPDVREILIKHQAEVPTESVEQFRDLIRRDVAAGIDFVKANNIRTN